MLEQLTKEEIWDLYFELGKAIERHLFNIEQYEDMKCYQAIEVEKKKIESLESIRKKIQLDT